MDPIYKSELNRNVPLGQPGEFSPVQIGPLSVWPPVVLAPMAGVTNWPFRAICREFGAGLYVSEMVTARPLVEGRAKTLMLAEFGEAESPRSLQLYGVDPYYVGEAVKWLVGEERVDHIDMNFGCPVPKVTRKGGGSAIPAKPRLLASIVRSAVRNASEPSALSTNPNRPPRSPRWSIDRASEYVTATCTPTTCARLQASTPTTGSFG